MRAHAARGMRLYAQDQIRTGRRGWRHAMYMNRHFAMLRRPNRCVGESWARLAGDGAGMRLRSQHTISAPDRTRPHASVKANAARPERVAVKTRRRRPMQPEAMQAEAMQAEARSPEVDVKVDVTQMATHVMAVVA